MQWCYQNISTIIKDKTNELNGISKHNINNNNNNCVIQATWLNFFWITFERAEFILFSIPLEFDSIATDQRMTGILAYGSFRKEGFSSLNIV